MCYLCAVQGPVQYQYINPLRTHLFRYISTLEIRDQIYRPVTFSRQNLSLYQLKQEHVGDKIGEIKETQNKSLNQYRFGSREKRSDVGEGRFDVGEGRFDVGEGRLDVGEGRLDVGEGRLDVGERRFDVGERRFDVGEGRLDVGEGRFDVGSF